MRNLEGANQEVPGSLLDLAMQVDFVLESFSCLYCSAMFERSVLNSVLCLVCNTECLV